MTGFNKRFDELTHEMEITLDEDLAALKSMPKESRLERYNSIKANEEKFAREFSQEYDQLTASERKEIRSKFRLARLFLAASFYDEDAHPDALSDEFLETELQAVVDFERYKRFDVLTEEEIEAKIHRMEGEVHELVEDYTSTQIANMDDLMDNPDVQTDLMRQLLDRYQERREKIRQGFFVYVESHGLEHMVESIEAAVTAVSESAGKRKKINEELREEIGSLSESIEGDLGQQQRSLEAELQRIDWDLKDQNVDPDQIESEIDSLNAQGDSLAEKQETLLNEIEQRIERTSKLEEQVESEITQLEEVKTQTKQKARQTAREETATVVEEELKALKDQRKQLRAEIETLERERSGIEARRDRLVDKQDSFLSKVEDIGESLGKEADLPEEAVSSSVARLLEMDYIGRFDTAMYDAKELQTVEGVFEVPSNYWDDRSEHLNERARVNQLVDEGEDPDQYPLNRRARYWIADSAWFGLSRSREMVIEATVRSNLEAFTSNGFDASPADLDALLDVVNNAVSEAQTNDYHYLIGVASPTGWTDGVIHQVEGGDVARSRYSRHLSLLLVDLQSGEIYYDDNDAIASNHSDLYQIPVIDERVNKCVQLIRENYVNEVGVDNVLLREVVENHDYDVREVKTAFEQLEQSGEGEVLQVDEYGLALDFSG